MSVPSPAAAPASGHSIGYNLAAIAALVLLVAVGAAYLIDRAGRLAALPPPSLADGTPVVQTVGGRELTIPTNWIRHGEQIRPGFAAQVDIRVVLDLFPGAAPVPVEVTLLPRGRARASSTLLDKVYLHEFGEGTETGVAGLVGKPLRGENGYAGDVVWYDALAPFPFVAKCAAPVAPERSERCQRTVHLPSGLAAVFSFDAPALQAWRIFDAQMTPWLDRIGAL